MAMHRCSAMLNCTTEQCWRNLHIYVPSSCSVGIDYAERDACSKSSDIRADLGDDSMSDVGESLREDR